MTFYVAFNTEKCNVILHEKTEEDPELNLESHCLRLKDKRTPLVRNITKPFFQLLLKLSLPILFCSTLTHIRECAHARDKPTDDLK